MPAAYGFQGASEDFWLEPAIDPLTGALGGRERTEVHAVRYFDQFGRHGFQLQGAPARNVDPTILPDGQLVETVTPDASGDAWIAGSALSETTGEILAGQYRASYVQDGSDLRPPGYVFVHVALADATNPLSFAPMDVRVRYQAVALLNLPQNLEALFGGGGDDSAGPGLPIRHAITWFSTSNETHQVTLSSSNQFTSYRIPFNQASLYDGVSLSGGTITVSKPGRYWLSVLIPYRVNSNLEVSVRVRANLSDGQVLHGMTVSRSGAVENWLRVPLEITAETTIEIHLDIGTFYASTPVTVDIGADYWSTSFFGPTPEGITGELELTELAPLA